MNEWSRDWGGGNGPSPRKSCYRKQRFNARRQTPQRSTSRHHEQIVDDDDVPSGKQGNRRLVPLRPQVGGPTPNTCLHVAAGHGPTAVQIPGADLPPTTWKLDTSSAHISRHSLGRASGRRVSLVAVGQARPVRSGYCLAPPCTSFVTGRSHRHQSILQRQQGVLDEIAGRPSVAEVARICQKACRRRRLLVQ
jgi:hypothetical protein